MSRSMTISVCGWSIFTSISGGKANRPLCIACVLDLLGEVEDLLGFSAVEAMTNSTGNCPPPGSAGGVTGNIWMPGIACSFCCTSGRIWKMVRSRSSHGLVDHAAEARAREGDLEGEVGFRDVEKDLVGRGRVAAGLVEGGVGRGVEDAEDHPLVLGRRQFLGRHDEHRDGQQAHDDPDQVDGRAGVQGGVEQAAVERRAAGGSRGRSAPPARAPRSPV